MALIRKTNALGLILLLLLKDVFYSKALISDFSLSVGCSGNKGKPGVLAKLVYVKVCHKSKPLVCSKVEDQISDINSNALFINFVRAIGRNFCLGKENGIVQFLNKTVTVWDQAKSSLSAEPAPKLQNEVEVSTRRDILVDTPDQPSQTPFNNLKQDDTIQATVNRLKIVIAVGTFLGFLFGILVTGIVIVVCTKKLQKYRNALQQDALRRTQDNRENRDDKYESVNYTYCDVNEEMCQRPVDQSSRDPNIDVSHKYHDCNLNTYNHLNENDENTTITPSPYDHVGKTSADTIQPVGEYKLLEPMRSEKDIDVGTLPTEKPIDSDARADSVSLTGEYELLEPMKSEKDVGTLPPQKLNDHIISDACADSNPISGEYRLLEPMDSKSKQAVAIGSLPKENATDDIHVLSKTNDSNYFELENV